MPFTRNQPLFIDFLGTIEQFVFGLRVDIEKSEGVLDQIELDGLIERGISGETGGMVDFEYDWFSLGIEHDIESQDVEAHVAGIVFWLGALVLVAHQGQPANDSLNGNVIDLFLELLNIEPLPC